MLWNIILVLVAAVAELAVLTSGECVCANTAVVMRTGASTRYSRRGVLYPGYCVVVTSSSGRRNQGYYWRNVDYNGQDTWIPDNGRWLSEHRCSSRRQENILSETSGGSSNNGGSNNNNNNGGSSGGSSSSSAGGCPNIVSRSAWGARSPTHRHQNMPSTPRYVFIHHSASGSCDSLRTCKEKVKAFQDLHIDDNGWADIGYSFLIGGDGTVYEGRGWGKVGAHTRNYNSAGLGICLIGNFNDEWPTNDALNAARRLIECGVSSGRIRSDYTLRGHRDMGSTECPGNNLYNIIRTWPNY